MNPHCKFCRIAAGNAPAQIVYEDEHVVAFRDINPAAPSHILIIPRRHITSVAEAKESDATLLGRLMLAAAKIAKSEGLKRGFRLVTNTGPAGGQSVFHMHFHLLGGRRMRWPPG